MIIVDLTRSRPERPSSARHRSLRVVLPSNEVDDARASWDPAMARRPFCALDEASYHLDSVSEAWSVQITPAPDVNPLDGIACPDDNALQTARADLQSLAVPLLRSPPLRIRLARHSKGDVVMLNVHHAAGDGIAALFDPAEAADFADRYVTAFDQVTRQVSR